MHIIPFILLTFLFFTPTDAAPLPLPPPMGGARTPISSESGHSDTDEAPIDTKSLSAYPPGLYGCVFQDGAPPVCKPFKIPMRKGTIIQKCGPGLPSYILCTLLVPSYTYLYAIGIIGLMPGMSRKLLLNHPKRLIAMEIGRLICVFANTTILVVNLVERGLRPITIMSSCQWTMDVLMACFTAKRTHFEVQLVHVQRKFATGATLTRHEAKILDAKEKLARIAGGRDSPGHACDACAGFPGPLCDACYQRRRGPLPRVSPLLPLVARGAWRRRASLALSPGRLNGQGARTLLVTYHYGTRLKFARDFQLRGQQRRPLRPVSRRGAEQPAAPGPERGRSEWVARPKLKAVNLRRASTRVLQGRRRDRRRQSRSSDWVDVPDVTGARNRRRMASVSTAAATYPRPTAMERDRDTEQRMPERGPPLMAGALGGTPEGSAHGAPACPPRNAPEATGATGVGPDSRTDHEPTRPRTDLPSGVRPEAARREAVPAPEEVPSARERPSASRSFLWRRAARMLAAGAPTVAAQLFRMPGSGRSPYPSPPRSFQGDRAAMRARRQSGLGGFLIMPTAIPGPSPPSSYPMHGR